MTTPETAPKPAMPPAGRTGERIVRVNYVRRLLIRPELGSVAGAAIVFVFFAIQSSIFASVDGMANWLDPASTLGIMAVAVALLMIGGEFDLSAGVMTGSVGLITAILATRYGWNVWGAMLASLGFALAVGAMNGILVVRTKLPSFIVTLATFLMLQGLNLGVTKALTGTVQVSGLDKVLGYESAKKIFASTVKIAGSDFRISILWWIIVTALATWVLMRTRPGNWVFSAGGNPLAARNAGVPVQRTKIVLFVTTAGAAWLVGVMAALRIKSAQASTGIGEEFIYIIAAVIGGCLLTGGYGSAIGAAVGALIFGMANKGIVYAEWDADWFTFFLGLMLLLATLTNNYVRRFAEETRKK